MSWLSELDDEDERYSEESVRLRPSRGGSRPRSKHRPSHSDAVTGMVLGVDRGRYRVLVDENLPSERSIIAATARELPRKSVVTGDRVRLVGDVSGEDGTLARIVGVEARSSVLRRSADDTDQVERIIVANADQLLIVCAAAQPEPRVRLVDRYLVAAYDAGIRPLLCITKTDLADPAEFLKHFSGLDLPVFYSSEADPPIEELRSALLGHHTVLVGHSGVGKSTLINALVPEAKRAVGVVNFVTGRGRHTSSSSVSLRVSRGSEHGWAIDTPGIRSFGLGHVDRGNLLGAFAELAELAEDCPRGCLHRSESDDCAIVLGLAELPNGPESDRLFARFDSFQRLAETLGEPEH